MKREPTIGLAALGLALSGLFAAPGCPAEPTFEKLPVACEATLQCEDRFASTRPELAWTCAPAGFCAALPLCDAAGAPERCEGLDFTPGLAVRSRPGGGGPFRLAPLLQGDPAATDPAAQDLIRIPAGAQIGGALHAHVDLGQGTAMAWVTPEWSVEELPEGGAGLWRVAGLGVVVLPGGDLQLLREGASPLLFSGLAEGWRAGETRLLLVRWASRRQGGFEYRLDLGDRGAQLGSADAFTGAPEGLLGAADETGLAPARARIAGLTIYRRPLLGGAGFGLDLGHGDELAALASGLAPSEVTGSWDLLFALPTRQEAGALQPELEAWSHPLGEDLLAGVGLALDASARSFFGRESGVSRSALSGLERLGGGLQMSSPTAGVGVFVPLPLAEGDSFVVRALCFSPEGSLSRPTLSLKTDLGQLARVSGAAGLGPDHPSELIFTGELPPGATNPKLRLFPAGDAGRIGCHSIEVHRNLLLNPSLETGSTPPGEPWTPDGWTHEINPLAVSVIEEDAEQGGLVHSGGRALRYVADFSGTGEAGFVQLRQEPPGQTQEGVYAVGGFFRWIDGQPPGLSVTNGSLFVLTRPVEDGRKFDVTARAQVDGWIHVAGVGRRHRDRDLNAHNDILRWGGPRHMQDAELLIDDAYVLPMNAVTLEPQPASVAGSTRGGWVRLDGADRLTLPVRLSRDAAELVVVYRRGPVGGAPLAGPAAPCTLLELSGDPENLLRLVQSGDDLLLEGLAGAEPLFFPLPGGAPRTGGAHRLRLGWQGATLRLRRDQAPEITLPLPAGGLARDLTTLHLGEREGAPRDCDLEIRLPGPHLR